MSLSTTTIILRRTWREGPGLLLISIWRHHSSKSKLLGVSTPAKGYTADREVNYYLKLNRSPQLTQRNYGLAKANSLGGPYNAPPPARGRQRTVVNISETAKHSYYHRNIRLLGTFARFFTGLRWLFFISRRYRRLFVSRRKSEAPRHTANINVWWMDSWGPPRTKRRPIYPGICGPSFFSGPFFSAGQW